MLKVVYVYHAHGARDADTQRKRENVRKRKTEKERKSVKIDNKKGNKMK